MKITTALLAAVLIAVTVVDGVKLGKRISTTSTSMAAGHSSSSVSASESEFETWVIENNLDTNWIDCLPETMMEDLKPVDRNILDEMSSSGGCEADADEKEKFIAAIEVTDFSKYVEIRNNLQCKDEKKKLKKELKIETCSEAYKSLTQMGVGCGDDLNANVDDKLKVGMTLNELCCMTCETKGTGQRQLPNAD